MWIGIFIVFIVIVALILCFSGSDKEDISVTYKWLLDEVVEKLRIIQEFTNSPFWDTESGLTMILPVNELGEMYRPDSNQIEISILLYENNPETIKLCTHTNGILEHFRLVQVDRSFQYKTNTIGTFRCNYRAMMSAIHKRVASEFPNVPFEFDGSRILTKKMKK